MSTVNIIIPNRHNTGPLIRTLTPVARFAFSAGIGLYSIAFTVWVPSVNCSISIRLGLGSHLKIENKSYIKINKYAMFTIVAKTHALINLVYSRFHNLGDMCTLQRKQTSWFGFSKKNKSCLVTVPYDNNQTCTCR